MYKTTVWSIIISLTLILGLAGAIALVRTSQDYRSSASFATGSITLLPSPIGSVKVGSENKVHVSVNGGDKSVNGLQTLICYGPEFEVDTSAITAGTNFELILSKITQSGTRNCVDLAVGGKTNATLLSGVVEAATITFKAVLAGSGTIEIVSDKTIVSGENPGQTDNQIAMGSITNSTYTVSTSTGLTGAYIEFDTDIATNISLGTEKYFSVIVKPNSDVQINGLQTYVCYGSQLEVKNVSASDNFELITSNIVKYSGKFVNYQGENCVNLAVGAKTSASLTNGDVKVATITFKAIDEGSGEINYAEEEDITVASITNPGTTNNGIKFVAFAGKPYNVVSATTKLLNFKVSFQGVTPASECANNMKVSVVVLSAGTTQVNSNVSLTKTSEVNHNGNTVFQGSVPLTGISLPANNVAVFVKGPKHLQVKYGEDGQGNSYNEAGGKMYISSDLNDNKVYNFSEYPLLAGDITGSTDGLQDGIVDGRDFSYVKTNAIARDTVSAGGSIISDLDGSCQVNAADVTTLMLSLKEKQAQLY